MYNTVLTLEEQRVIMTDDNICLGVNMGRKRSVLIKVIKSRTTAGSMGSVGFFGESLGDQFVADGYAKYATKADGVKFVNRKYPTSSYGDFMRTILG